MIGKLLAGLVCGAATAVPAMFNLQVLLGAYLPMLRNDDLLDTIYLATPFVAAALVLVACLTAFDAVAAWWRGCLIAVVVGVALLLQTMQCFGFDTMTQALVGETETKRALKLICPRDFTPLIAGIVAAGTCAFGIGAGFLWRRVGRSHDL